MAGPVHTYGSTCLLAPQKVDLAALRESPTPPKVNAQFFYTSSLPIDDPLTPLPAPSTSSASAQTKSSPQPFSARDNIALEEAWTTLREARKAKLAQSTNKRAEASEASGRATGVPLRERASSGRVRSSGTRSSLQSYDEASSSADVSTQDHERGLTGSKRREGSPLGRLFKSAKLKSSSSPGAGEAFSEEVEAPSSQGESFATAPTGSPFVRAPTRRSWTPSEPRSEEDTIRISGQFREWEASQEADVETQSPDPSQAAAEASRKAEASQSSETLDVRSQESDGESAQYKVPVGVSRLHLVELPNLKMKPIYWSPLHDISDVLRATWFYKNTMLPVEPVLANKLEEGYLYMRPWTEAWQDELNSCVENGAEAEMKIVYKLWEEDRKPVSRPGTAHDLKTKPSEADDRAREDEKKDLTFEDNLAASGADEKTETKPFKNSSVIYVDATDAQILRPSLLPSVSRGRRPLSSIRKGRQIGVPVVRGFNRQIWDKLHPSKQTKFDMRHYLMRPQTRNANLARGEQICYACAIEESRPSPSDLVLVIHGIGQKLSERVESFHFTHAINGFRRFVNMELNNEEIWPHIRPDHGGIMVLPVNWRSTLSLADAEIDSRDSDDPMANHFTLKDITPDSIPAIRTLISDVMLDIPYYLSHHKPKMIQAVVKEANRIYRLWCQNNPGFHENGRVHLVAHSLGSAMALDILSHQPTKLPPIDFSTDKLHDDIFEFDPKNVFFCGSPAGFFLLLNKANLLPRRGRDKPGREGEDRQPGVAGETDTYGCLALDNLYNIMHTTDPIAYRMNAAVDSDLAESLKPAAIPTSTTSFFQSFSSVFRWSSSSHHHRKSVSTTAPAAISKLPSNVEMETHDFTREEIAEKRMLLLNDNGQIDYYLSGGGGPLNIQYLNMLSAHSSYWVLPEFVRFLVLEIARRPGREGTLLALRAEKKKGWKAER